MQNENIINLNYSELFLRRYIRISLNKNFKFTLNYSLQIMFSVWNI
jgi:hypothetical protein